MAPRLANTQRSKAILIFLLASAFYLYEYVLQVSPSVMASEIMTTFKVEAAGLGMISACYFYSYAFMQLPAGLLFDCYGPRRLITLAILLCAAGAVFFSLTNSITMACLGRFLIGFGSAFSFIGVLVLISRWFEARHFALLAGFAQAGSSIGAIFGEYPLAKLSMIIGWRSAMWFLAALGVVLSLLVWLIVRDAPYMGDRNQRSVSALKEWRKLLIVMRKPQSWWVGLYAGCSWTPIAIFGVLWGIPFLQELCGLSVSTAAAFCSVIWVSIGVFSPLIGWFSDRINNRRLPLMLASSVGFLGSFLLLFSDVLPWFFVLIGLVSLGFAAGSQSLSFALVKENNLPEYIGSASGFNNMSILIGATIFQPVYGIILKAIGDVRYEGLAPIYSVSSHKISFMMIPAIYAVGFLTVFFFIKETKKHKAK